jgi:arylsulfatase A-like enzyme
MVAPPVVGAAYLLALAAWAGTRTTSVEADVGDVRRAEAMEAFMTRRFASEILRMKIGIAATAIGLGLLLGLVAELLQRLRGRGGGAARRRRPLAGLALESLALVAALHALLVAWAMADTPQLYAAEWYARGGFLRTAQVLVTDRLGPAGVLLAGVVLAVAYVRPARIVFLVRRVAIELRRPFRGLVLRPPAAAVALALASAAAVLSDVARPAEAAPPSVSSSPSSSSSLTASPMNVLVLAADSLRADRLDPRTAPNLVLLAERGVRFDRAYVSLPRTFPSWVNILTGRHAHHHGIRSMFPTWEERAKDFDALPERFGRAGYGTAVESDYAGDIFGRIDLGFSRVDTPSFDFRQLVRQKALERETPLLPVLHSKTGRRLFPVMRELAAAADPRLLADDVESALRDSSQDRKKRPFFMTVFFSTAHFPYAAPAPYYAKYTDPAYRGRFKYHKPLGLGQEAPPDEDDKRQIRALYDGAVRGVDDAIGKVLRTLDRLGLAERTIVVVTADHGETLFEDGHSQGHGDHLFGDQAIHVPLLVVDPRVKKPQRVDAIVRDVDIAPTLYELAGVPPPSDLDGRSLVPALRGEALPPRFAYAESELWFTEEIPGLPPELRMPYPGVVGLTEIDSRHNAEIVLKKEMAPPTLMARHRMIRDERFKLVYVPTRAGVRYMLFDTATDPEERHDVAASLPNEVARLRAELWSWMLKDPAMEQRNGFLVPRAGAGR